MWAVFKRPRGSEAKQGRPRSAGGWVTSDTAERGVQPGAPRKMCVYVCVYLCVGGVCV